MSDQKYCVRSIARSQGMACTARMTTLHAELYDALLEAKVSDARARAAAAAVLPADQMVRPDDLEHFATKQDLEERFATKAGMNCLQTWFDARLEATECRIMAAMAHMESRLTWKMFVAGRFLLGLLLAAMGICTSYITQQL